MLFEVFVPEGAISILSQLWAEHGQFGDVTQAMESFTRCQVLAVSLVAVSFISTMHFSGLGALCIAPAHADGGGGLLSLSACCPQQLEYNTTRYADADEAWRGGCWMDQHYPSTCHGVSGPGDEWVWGERWVAQP